ncbi:MAG: hypothetical protein ACQESF_05730 [Nanobdellota archaeon]
MSLVAKLLGADKPDEPKYDRREFLFGTAKDIAEDALLLSGAYGLAKTLTPKDAYAQSLPHNLYNPKGPEVSEENFKETLRQHGLVWVMYEWTGADESHRKLGNNFFEVLKQEFGNQVDGYIRINTDSWSDNGAVATREITKNVYPSFCLYNKGVVVNDGTPTDIRIRGPPKADRMDWVLSYITDNSVLKRT